MSVIASRKGIASSPAPAGGELADSPPDLSIVIPLWNERENLGPLKDALDAAVAGAALDAEFIFVDDGSRDGSWEEIERLAAPDPRMRAVRFRRNYGKAAALSVGFGLARAPVVITMDADLQDDPKEIPNLLARLAEGYDVVSGWKKKRRDPISKTIPSLLFNRVVSSVTRVRIHDMNCGLKAYRSSVVKEIDLYGELHRYIPALAAWKGYRIGETPVEHRPRRSGRSKYGPWRFVAGFLDLLTIMMVSRFTLKPLHFFGTLGLLFGATGTAVNLHLVWVWFHHHNIQGRTPLLMLGVLLIIVGIQLFSTGLLAELSARQFSRGSRDYSVEGRIRT